MVQVVLRMLTDCFDRPSGADYTVQKLLLGTHTSGVEQNYLMIANVKLPLDDTEIDARKFDDENPGTSVATENDTVSQSENVVVQPDLVEVGGFGGVSGKVEIQIRINHEGEINRARVMPQNEYIIATKTISSDVYIFDVTKHPSSPEEGSGCNPDFKCVGHTKEGYGLSWNPHQAYHLVSGSDDGMICEWNLENAKKVVEPLNKFTGHTDVIEDVAWHMHHPKIFGSVGDDKMLLL